MDKDHELSEFIEKNITKEATVGIVGTSSVLVGGALIGGIVGVGIAAILAGAGILVAHSVKNK